MSVFTDTSAMSPEQVERLRESAESQNEFILSILRSDPRKGYAIFQMIELTGMYHSSVNRALSSMSSSNHRYKDRFADKCGRMPIVKLKEIKVHNPDTNKDCCTYWFNHYYEKPCGQQSLFD